MPERGLQEADGVKVWDYPQQSEQWFRARAGRITASNLSRIITASGKDSSQWEDYAIDLCAECIRWDEIKWAGNAHTDRGNELEPLARDRFTEVMGLETIQVGFITRDDEIVGCSPDSMVEKNGKYWAGLEIKCPLAKNHAKYLLADEVPNEYMAQVHGSMAITGLNWWYFMSYCPGMTDFIKRVKRDDYTEEIGDAIDRFLIYYQAKRKELMPLLAQS